MQIFNINLLLELKNTLSMNLCKTHPKRVLDAFQIRALEFQYI